MTIRLLGRSLLGFVAVLFAGCGGGSNKAEGVVTLDGATVAGATVTFNPVGEGRPVSAITDSQGIFKIEGKDGLVAGKYKVTVTKREAVTFISEEAKKDPTLAMKEMMKAGKMAGDASKKTMASPKAGTPKEVSPNTLPAIYAEAGKTPFEFEIPHSGQIKLALQKK